MTEISYCDVFAINLDHDHDERIGVGDIVRTGTNLFPHFEVIAVNGGKAWLRDQQTSVDHLASLARCRKIEAPALAMAA